MAKNDEPIIERATPLDPHKGYQLISQLFAKANNVELIQTRKEPKERKFEEALKMEIMGERVRECREKAGMTLEDVAGLVGVSVEELSDCEDGLDCSCLLWEKLKLLARALGSTTEYLMGYDDGDVLPLEYGQPSHETMRRRALDRVNRALERLEISAEDHRLGDYFTALDFISLASDLSLITYEEHVGFNKKADALHKEGVKRWR